MKKVQPTVNELMAEDISAMKSGKQTSEGAAAKAEELAGLATDEASKFLLLKGAFASEGPVPVSEGTVPVSEAEESEFSIPESVQ